MALVKKVTEVKRSYFDMFDVNKTYKRDFPMLYLTNDAINEIYDVSFFFL